MKRLLACRTFAPHSPLRTGGVQCNSEKPVFIGCTPVRTPCANPIAQLARPFRDAPVQGDVVAAAGTRGSSSRSTAPSHLHLDSGRRGGGSLSPFGDGILGQLRHCSGTVPGLVATPRPLFPETEVVCYREPGATTSSRFSWLPIQETHASRPNPIGDPLRGDLMKPVAPLWPLTFDASNDLAAARCG